MNRKNIFISCFILFCDGQGFAQEDYPGKNAFQIAIDAGKMYQRGAYDSAIRYYKRSLDTIKKYDLYRDDKTTVVLNGLGDVYRQKKDYVNAHRYYTLSLDNAKAYDHKAEGAFVLTALVALHNDIVQKDISFPYPSVDETIEDDVFFSIREIRNDGDSLLLTISAGKLDGIFNSSRQPVIYTRDTKEDTINHNGINFYGNARITRIENNYCVLKAAKNSKIDLLLGDFVFLRAVVPLKWEKLKLGKNAKNNVFFRNNSNEKMYSFRYLYYYGNSYVESLILEMAKASIKEIVDTYGSDTLTNEFLGSRPKIGVFAGFNMIKAITESTDQHVTYFLNYVVQYPRKYAGNDFKFSGVYTTWLYYNAPLIQPDIKHWLLSFPHGNVRIKKARQIQLQLTDEHIADKLLDEGLSQVKMEDIRSARETAELIADIHAGTGDSLNSGWSDYLFALIEKRMARPVSAGNYLAEAERKFLSAGNREGMEWIRSTRDDWKRSKEIVVGVQNGHLFPFIIAEPADARYFATGGKDNLIKIWDKTLGKEILTLNEHRDEINSLQYSDNGRYLVSTSADSTICIWNAYNYTLLNKFHTQGPVKSAVFSPDAKHVVCAGEDNLIRFRDVHTGEVVKTLDMHKGRVLDLAYNPKASDWLYSCGADSMVYQWDLETGKWLRWYRLKGKVLELRISNNGRYMSTISTDSLFTVWDIESFSKLAWGNVNVYTPGNRTYFGSGSFSPDSRYFAYAYKQDSFNIVDLTDFYQRIYPTNQADSYLNLADMAFSKDGVSLYARFDMGGPLRIYNFAGWDIRNNTTLSSRDIRPFSNLTVGVQFTADDNGLVILHNEVGKIDLRNANYETLYSEASFILNPYLVLNDENLGTWFSESPATLHIYDYRKKTTVRKFALPDGETIRAYELAQSANKVFMGTASGLIHAWKLKDGKPLFAKRYGEGEGIIQMTYDSLRNRLMAITEKGIVYIISAETGDTTATIRGIDANFTAASDKFIYITTSYGWLYKYDATSFTELNRMKVNMNGEPSYQIVLSPDNRYVVLQGTFSSLVTIDAVADSILYSIHDHDYGGTMIAISRDCKRIATAGFDSKINLLDLPTGKRIVSVLMPMDRGPVITDTNGHYLAARNALDAIIFSYNNNAYTFDQFDLQLNRPDIILSRIGRADTALLRSYFLAYKKRLKKLGSDEVASTSDMHLPVVRIKDRFSLQAATTKQVFDMEIECSDSRFKLASVQVLVNNCPVLGITGRDLKNLDTSYLVEKVSIPLSEGLNDIKVYCTNEKGVTSLREAFSITSKYKPAQPGKVYFVGIGIADYQDRKMNLGYSVKDIRDLAKTFDNLYSNIVIDTLINRKATRENILAIKKKLLKTTVNDRVILAVTGHGLLGDSLDFYYATWDVDFSKPESRGVKYDDLESLLTDIPARQKLMLIDACHSGALDKDELLALKQDTISQVVLVRDKEKNVKGRAPRGLIKKSSESTMSANSTFEMMQRLFSDLSAGNGAVIISAAGGMEYAFESGKWNNGVFTFCIRKGIEEKQADRDGGNLDGRVSVQELLKYVSRKVSEITGGKQRPTSRRENIDYEWTLRN